MAPAQTPRKRLWLQVLKVGANGLVIGGVSYVFFRSFKGRGDEVIGALRAIHPLTIVAILVIGFVFNLVLHQGWYAVTQRLGVRLPYRESLPIWMFSILGKYIPGKVMLVLSRTLFYQRRGMPAVWVAYGVVLEHLFALAAAVAIFLLALGTTDVPEVRQFRVFGAVGLAALLLLLSPQVLNWGAGFASRRLRLTARPRLSAMDFLAIFAMFLFAWLWLGLGNFLVVQALSDVGWNHFLYLTGAHALAGIVGVFALFAPTGIGVKEGMMFFLFSRIMPAYQASLATLALRVWLTTTELAMGAVGWWLCRRLGMSVPISAREEQPPCPAP